MEDKKTCGNCRFFKFEEMPGYGIEYGFDGVCIVEPPILPTASKCRPCEMHKFRTEKVFDKYGKEEAK